MDGETGANLAASGELGTELANHFVLHTPQTASILRTDILVLFPTAVHPVSRTVTNKLNKSLQRAVSAMKEKVWCQEQQENGDHLRCMVREGGLLS